MVTVSQTLNILTYNIRYDNPSDGVNAWPERKSLVSAKIHAASPVIFGIQEGFMAQVKYLDSCFSGYSRIGVGRDDGKTKGEYCAVYYNLSHVKLIKSGHFWLSETAGKPQGDGMQPVSGFVPGDIFKDIITGNKFWVFNTHFDHVGTAARKNSALMILDKVKQMNKAGQPVILMGDLNCESNSEPVRILTTVFQDSKVAGQHVSTEPDGTFNGFGSEMPPTMRIDFIFTAFGAKSVNYRILNETQKGRFASDHFPVTATITL